MKTSELNGDALDWAVAKCEGYEIDSNGCAVKDGIAEFNLDCFNPSEVWAQGGPIIEREEIELKVLASCIDLKKHPTYKSGDAWEANLWPADVDLIEYCGPTPLIAAMRCYVASKLGDEVEVPDELA
jgi:hypothetical protein